MSLAWPAELPPEPAADQFAHVLASVSSPPVSGPGALAALDRALDSWLSFAEVYEVPREHLDALSWPLAAFAGQILVQWAGAAWVASSESDPQPALRLPDGRLLDLLGSARRVLLGRAPPGFAAFEALPRS